jgi:hypothetical protein
MKQPRFFPKRPDLDRSLSVESFLEWYYYTRELSDFLRAHGIQHQGTKPQLQERVIHFLTTGQALNIKKAPKKNKQTQTLLTLDQEIGSFFTWTWEARAFYQEQLNLKKFRCSVMFQKCIKSNPNATHRQALTVYQDMHCSSKKVIKQEIEPQFEYMSYTRDFFADPSNHGRSKQDCITCWNYKKNIPGPKVYAPEDVLALSFK